ncbi:hypothetical protein [Salibacterium sp. K-3]
MNSDIFTVDEWAVLIDSFRQTKRFRESIADEVRLCETYRSIENKLKEIAPEEAFDINYVSDRLLD